MAAAPLSPEEQARLLDALRRHNGNKVAVERETGFSYNTVAKYAHLAAAGDVPPLESPRIDDSPGLDAIIREAVEKALAAKAAEPKVEPAPAVTVPIPGRTRVVTLDKRYERVAFLSDMHHPFHDPAAIRAMLAVLRDYRPQLILLAGDQLDFYAISDHDKEPGRMDCVQDEFDSARPTWQEIDEQGSDVIWLDGNHEVRMARMQARNPGLFRLRSMEIPIAADLPKRWLYLPNQTRIKMGSLTALHGDLKGRGTSMMHAAAGMLRKLRTSCIFGHLHRFQTFMETTEDGTYRAGFANGHLCDVEKALYISAPDWQQGFSTIDFDWSENLFHVTPHLIVRGLTRWNGVTYRH